MRPYLGPPATLGTTLAAGLDLWGDCLDCRRHVHVDTAQLESLVERYGHDTPLLDLIARLVCTGCGGRLNVRVHVPRLAKFGGRV